MTTEVWTRDQFNPVYKSIRIYGPDDFTMDVDYDDVDHVKVQDITEQILVILNHLWGPYLKAAEEAEKADKE